MYSVKDIIGSIIVLWALYEFVIRAQIVSIIEAYRTREELPNTLYTKDFHKPPPGRKYHCEEVMISECENEDCGVISLTPANQPCSECSYPLHHYGICVWSIVDGESQWVKISD